MESYQMYEGRDIESSLRSYEEWYLTRSQVPSNFCPDVGRESTLSAPCAGVSISRCPRHSRMITGEYYLYLDLCILTTLHICPWFLNIQRTNLPCLSYVYHNTTQGTTSKKIIAANVGTALHKIFTDFKNLMTAHATRHPMLIFHLSPVNQGFEDLWTPISLYDGTIMYTCISFQNLEIEGFFIDQSQLNLVQDILVLFFHFLKLVHITGPLPSYQ